MPCESVTRRLMAVDPPAVRFGLAVTTTVRLAPVPVTVTVATFGLLLVPTTVSGWLAPATLMVSGPVVPANGMVVSGRPVMLGATPAPTCTANAVLLLDAVAVGGRHRHHPAADRPGNRGDA